MKKIVMICPYFGKLPRTQMEFVLKSCENNPSVDWIILTDDKEVFEIPNNVNIIITKLQDLKKEFSKKLGFNINLDSAYKLCDFKPLYGFLFSDLINKYDYWGHFDLSDAIFGDIRHFITDDIISEYDKIGVLGHFTLYRNTKTVNERFKMKTKSNISYKDILSSEENFAFDELNEYSINTIYLENDFKLLRIDDMYDDISCLKYRFTLSKYNYDFKRYVDNSRFVFEWNNGKLYEIKKSANTINRKEILYVHFQKRDMELLFNEKDINKITKYYIVPSGFAICDKDFDSFFDEHCRGKLFYKKFFTLKYKNIKKRINKLVKK